MDPNQKVPYPTEIAQSDLSEDEEADEVTPPVRPRQLRAACVVVALKMTTRMQKVTLRCFMEKMLPRLIIRVFKMKHLTTYTKLLC